MMDLIYTAVAGLVAGFIAGKIMPGEEPGGIWGTLAFGIVGAYLGKTLFEILHLGSGMVMNLIASVIGACLVIWIWKKFIGPMIGGSSNS